MYGKKFKEENEDEIVKFFSDRKPNDKYEVWADSSKNSQNLSVWNSVLANHSSFVNGHYESLKFVSNTSKVYINLSFGKYKVRGNQKQIIITFPDISFVIIKK